MNTNVRELMLAGAHFGHRSRFWNPKMKPYIYDQYHTTHIINLDQTVTGLQKAVEFLQSLVASGGTVLYLCTKNAATEIIEDEARAVKMPYVNRRWLGGMLTNFKTTRNSVDTLTKIENDIAAGALKNMTKKEGMQYIMSQQKLEKAIGGIREMQEPPDALFIIDVGWHKGAVREATKLGIPIVAIVDTNHSPDNIDYIIPGNDDSRLAIEIYTREVSTAIAAGKAEWESKQAADAKAGNASPEKEAAPVGEEKKNKVIIANKARKKPGAEEGVIVEEVGGKPKKIVKAKRAPAKVEADGKDVDEPKEKVANTTKADKADKADNTDKVGDVTAAAVKQLREATGLGMMECKKALVECNGDFDAAREVLRVKSGAKADSVSGRTAGEGRLAYAEHDKVGAMVEVSCETDFVARDKTMAAFADTLAQAVARNGEAITDLKKLTLPDGGDGEEARQNMVMKLGENIGVRRSEILTAKANTTLCSYMHAGDKIAAMCTVEGDADLGRDICMHIAAMRPRYLDAADVPAAELEKEQAIFKAQAVETGKPDDIAEKIAAGKMSKHLSEITLLGQSFVKDGDRTVKEVLDEKQTVVHDFRLLIVGQDGH